MTSELPNSKKEFKHRNFVPPLTAAPGPAEPWQPSFQVHKGAVNLATGNLLLRHHVVGWKSVGPGVGLALFFNSQSTGSTTVGPKWSHSYQWSISGTSPAVVTRGDGKQLSFTLSSGSYSAPTGHYETLVQNTNGSWTFTQKNGTVLSFDSAGKLTSIQDSNANTTTLTYSSGQLSQVQDQFGRSLTLAYTSGKLTSVTDFESRTWTLGYDGSGRLTTVTDPALNSQTYTTQFAYNSDNNVTSTTNRLNKTWTYSYTGNVFQTSTDPLSNVSGNAPPETGPGEDEEGFSSNNQQSTPPDQLPQTYPVDTVATVYVENSEGAPAEYGMNADGRTTAYRDGVGNQTNFSYDSNNNVLSIVEPGGATTTQTFDSNGNVLTVTDASNRTTTYTYDSQSNVLTEVLPGGSTTTHTYDSDRNRLTTTDGTNRTVTFAYNGNGTLSSFTNSDSKTTTFGYNSAGNLTSVSNPLSQTTTFTYTANRLTSTTDARSRTISHTYDAWGRRTGVTNPVTANQSFTYDAEGQLTQATDGTGTRSFTYDAVGHKLTQTDPRGTTSATYSAGLLQTQTDVSSRTISYTYDGRELLTGISDGTQSVAYTHNTQGRVTKVAYSNGVETNYAYDGDGRMTSMVHKWTLTGNTILGFALTYNTAGRLNQVTESPSGAVTTYTFDNEGRVLTENRTGSTPYTSTYTYNALGLRATAVLTNNSVSVHNGSYSYDNGGRLTSVTDSVTSSGLGGSYTWHADGTLATYPGSGYTRKLDYDEAGQMTSIKKDFGGGTVTNAFSYEYAFDGALRHRVDTAAATEDWFPCGVACEAGDLTTLGKPTSSSTWSVDVFKLAQFYNTDLSLGGLYNDHARIINSSGTVTYSATHDIFGVERGSATPVQLPESCTDAASIDDEDVQTQLDRLDLSFTSASSGYSMMMPAVAGFTCGKKVPKIPWWMFPCRKAAEATARSEYCRHCRGLCNNYCDEEALQDSSFDYAKCLDDCAIRAKKCRNGKKFPPYF